MRPRGPSCAQAQTETASDTVTISIRIEFLMTPPHLRSA
jgi:hypothetical protein